MTNVLLVSQDKGGTAKTLISRGLAEVVPGAPVFEIDSSPRMFELGKRAKFFKMRASRDEIDQTGGTISRAEFDPVINAIASAMLPTIVDVGANTGASLLSAIGGLADDFSAAGVQFGLLVVTTAEPGAVAEVPKLFALAAPWVSARFLVDNRFHGEIDSKILLKIAAGARVTCLLKQVMDEDAAAILQAGGLASITKLDAKSLNEKFGIARGSRMRRDLTRTRLQVMQAVRLAAEWMVA